MKKPKFKVPRHIEKRSGRIALFLASVAAVCYLLVRVGRDYKTLYEGLKAVTPFATESVMNAADFTADFWWIVAIGAILLTMLFYAVTKSGTIFTVLSILVWLAGVAAYVALWLPSRGLERAAGG